MKKILIITAVVLLAPVMAGCGYTTGSLLPERFKTIYVDNFANKIDISGESSDRRGYRIYRSGLETDITTGIIDRFIFDGNLTIVHEGDADLILRGDLVNYAREPLRYDKFDNVEEYRLFISVDMELEDMLADSVMWKEAGFTGETTYRTGGALAKSEDAALDDAMADLAKRVVEKTTEGW